MKAIVAMGAIFTLLACGCALGGEGRPTLRNSYFDGKEFRDGSLPHAVTVYHQVGFLPVVAAGDMPIPRDPLPKGTGGIVIYCYIQSSGGKIEAQGGSVPVAEVAVEVKGEGGSLLLRTDENGYAVAGVAAGTYEVSVKGVAAKFTVEQGSTTLLPIRAGKRMVD